MGNNNFDWIFGLIWLIVWIVGWITRSGARKKEAPTPRSKQDLDSAAPRELPADARRLLAQESKRGVAPVGSAPRPNPYRGDPVRESIYTEQNLRDTQDLLQDWYHGDETLWSPEAFDVIEKILIDRLGRLPAEEETEEQSLLDPDEDVDPGIKQLWLDGDLEGLASALEHDPDWLTRMDAAEALGAWNDPRGREYLTAALSDSADDVRGVAREILDELDEASAALPAKPPPVGVEPAASSEPVPAAAPESSVDQEAAASPGNIWASYRQQQAALESEQMARAPVNLQSDRSTLESLAGSYASRGEATSQRTNFLAGTAGALLGILLFYAALYYFGPQITPRPRGMDFLSQAWPWLAPLDLVVGTGAGAIGDMLGKGLVQSLGGEPGEGGTTRVLSAGMAGLGAAILLNLVLLWLSSL